MIILSSGYRKGKWFPRKRKTKMAHAIEIIDGKASMAYVGDKPWHGLGFELPEGVSPKEMQIAAGLDWEVGKYPLIYRREGDNQASAHSALVRETDGKMFDVVSDDWNPVQNSEAFDFFNQFCEQGSMTMNTAGSLKGGKHVWALAKIKNGSFDAIKNDTVDSYALFSNPHEYGKSVEVRITQIRVVCNNTLTWALGTKTNNKVNISHSRKFDASAVSETLGFSSEKAEQMKAQSELLASKRYTPEQMTEYLNRVFPAAGKKEISTPAKKIAELVDTQPGADLAPGTFWNLFNAVTYGTDHVLGRSVDTRLSRAWFGDYQQKKITALSTAIEMAMAA